MSVSAERPSPSALLQQLSTTFTSIPFNHMLGLRLETVTAEHVSMYFDMKQALIGNFLRGILHGGVISSVLDMAGGMVVMTNAIYKNTDKPVEDMVTILGKTSTIDLHIQYLNPGSGKTFIANAWLTKSGNKISFARMELSNETGTLIATGNGTYLSTAL